MAGSGQQRRVGQRAVCPPLRPPAATMALRPWPSIRNRRRRGLASRRRAAEQQRQRHAGQQRGRAPMPRRAAPRGGGAAASGSARGAVTSAEHGRRQREPFVVHPEDHARLACGAIDVGCAPGRLIERGGVHQIVDGRRVEQRRGCARVGRAVAAMDVRCQQRTASASPRHADAVASNRRWPQVSAVGSRRSQPWLMRA